MASMDRYELMITLYQLTAIYTANTILPVKVLVILAHPNPSSFNHAIANAAVDTLRINKHDVTFHDLYKENFDAILPAVEVTEEAVISPVIKKYCGELACAEGIIIVHPNWWGQPPAILKGYVDRIVRPGIAYKFKEGDGGEGIPVGLLKADYALVFNTSNTQHEREMLTFGDPLEIIWKNCIFGLCGVQHFYRRTFGVVVTSTAEERSAWLAEVQDTVGRYFPSSRNAT